MQNDLNSAADIPATNEHKKNKADKKPQTKAKVAQKPAELIGHVDAVALDLEADGRQALTFTLAPKTGDKRVITLVATGEALQTAIAMLLAAKLQDKKIAVTLSEADSKQSVARTLSFKSKRGKN